MPGFVLLCRLGVPEVSYSHLNRGCRTPFIHRDGLRLVSTQSAHPLVGLDVVLIGQQRPASRIDIAVRKPAVGAVAVLREGWQAALGANCIELSCVQLMHFVTTKLPGSVLLASHHGCAACEAALLTCR